MRTLSLVSVSILNSLLPRVRLTTRGVAQVCWSLIPSGRARCGFFPVRLYARNSLRVAASSQHPPTLNKRVASGLGCLQLLLHCNRTNCSSAVRHVCIFDCNTLSTAFVQHTWTILFHHYSLLIWVYLIELVYIVQKCYKKHVFHSTFFIKKKTAISSTGCLTF